MSSIVWSLLCHLSHIPVECLETHNTWACRTFHMGAENNQDTFLRWVLILWFFMWVTSTCSEWALLPELVSHQTKQAFQSPSYRKTEKKKKNPNVQRFVKPNLSVPLFHIMVITKYPQKCSPKATSANSSHTLKKPSGALSNNDYKFSGLLHLRPGSDHFYYSWKLTLLKVSKVGLNMYHRKL